VQQGCFEENLALKARGWKFTCSKNIVAPLLPSKEKAASIIFLT
jgi:hypothetical protein